MELKERIMGAAIEEFDEKGIRFTMDDLAARLGMSKRTIYEQFGNKEDIISTLIEEAFRSIHEQQDAIMKDESLDIVAKLKGILTVMPALSAVLDYRRIFEIQKQYPVLYGSIQNHLDTGWEATLALVEEGMAKRCLRPVNVAVFKEILFSTMDHMLKDRFLVRNSLTYDTALKETIDILFDGMVQRQKINE